jgi:hypothetical protein
MLLSMHGADSKRWAMQSILQKWRVYWGVNHESERTIRDYPTFLWGNYRDCVI